MQILFQIFVENGKAKKPNDEVFVGKWDESVHLKYAEGKNVVKKSMTKVKVSRLHVNLHSFNCYF